MTISEHNFEECLTAVRACREIANPNYGFRMQLKKYEEGKLKEVKLTHSHSHSCTVALLTGEGEGSKNIPSHSQYGGQHSHSSAGQVSQREGKRGRRRPILCYEAGLSLGQASRHPRDG